MTIAEFCDSEGLTTSSYRYWQREIKRRDAESPSSDADSTREPVFAAVELVDDRSCTAAVEIVVGKGYVIRVREQATAEQVRRVLQAVDELH
jgi:hypothetical protein